MASPRIENFDYIGRKSYFLTLCCHNHFPYFQNRKNFDLAFELLCLSSKEFKFEIWAFCFMPDHLHLLVQGIKSNSNLKSFVRHFKQISGFQFKKVMGAKLWQDSYYDHVLRKEENVKKVVKYIFENPVRANLVDRFLEYPFLGSLVFDVRRL